MSNSSTSPTASVASSVHRDAVCPFCSLLCDDLTVRADGALLAVERGGCPKAVAAFAGSHVTAEPLVDGRPASEAAALAQAVRILRRSRQPLIAGLGTDVAGMRAALLLAERSGAIVDHMHSAAMAHNRRILQSRGWITTTLGELRNRADLVVTVGLDCSENYQNFIARYVTPPDALQPERRQTRRLVELIPARQKPATAAVPVERIGVERENLPQFLGLVRAALRGRTVTATPRLAKAAAGLASALAAAKYPVLVWAPGQLGAATADLTIAAVCELIGTLNQTGRAAGLTLGGDDGGQTAQGTCTWLTGFPLHVSYAGDTLHYDPLLHRADRLLAENAVDAVIWVSSFQSREAPATRAPLVSIGRPTANRHLATVYLPTGIPGLDHAGQLLRTDTVVSLPLGALRAPLHESVASRLRALADSLPARP